MLHNGIKFDLVITGVPMERWLMSPTGTGALFVLLRKNSGAEGRERERERVLSDNCFYEDVFYIRIYV